jgi:hypothetical protein
MFRFTGSVTMPAAKKAAKKDSATKRISAAKGRDFGEVFAELRKLLDAHRDQLAVQTDKPGNYHTMIPSVLHRGKPIYFAGVRTGKNYVSYHLMAAYTSPELLQSMSPELKKRMQGKSCFNFKVVDQDCFAELRRLTAAGLKKFKSEEFRRNIEAMQ